MTTPITGFHLGPYASSIAAWLADRWVITAQAQLCRRLGVKELALGTGSGVGGGEGHNLSSLNIIGTLKAIRPARLIGSLQSSADAC